MQVTILRPIAGPPNPDGIWPTITMTRAELAAAFPDDRTFAISGKEFTVPAATRKQYRLMQAAAHGASNKVPASVAREFVAATPKAKRRKWSKKR